MYVYILCNSRQPVVAIDLVGNGSIETMDEGRGSAHAGTKITLSRRDFNS